jgi:acyl-CoA dehydrogenase
MPGFMPGIHVFLLLKQGVDGRDKCEKTALRALCPAMTECAMDFSLTPDQQTIRAAIEKICARFDDDYWLEKDKAGGFPHDFHAAFAKDGWLGIAMPEAYGGAGLGITEAAIMTQAIAESGAGFSGASAVHMNIFGLNPVVVYGTEEQKKRWLPPLIAGKERACFAVTEPNTGLNTKQIKVKAEKRDGKYFVSGQKVWISTAQVAEKILLLARAEAGLTLFYTDLDRKYVEVREIEKMGRHAVDSNQLFFDALPVPEADRIGEAGKGFEYILHGMNPERILIAAELVGLGRCAVARAAKYAKERIVFDRPIGQNQAIQHPLAANWMALEAANLMAFKAAALYDAGKPCGAEANAAKYLAGEACFDACQQAVMTFGGFGYAAEYHVERYLRESFVGRIAPVSRELILCFIAERVLGLPKSY